MKLLADENLESPIVQWLRDQGHDVSTVAALTPSADDTDVLALARQEARILITRDLDFGELIYRQRLLTHGIILLRIRAATMDERLNLFRRHWPQVLAHASDHFVVVSNRHIRVRPIHLPG